MSKLMTVIVNTCDGFEDCWDPFFILFKKYWYTCPYEIKLFTESKKYETDLVSVNVLNTKPIYTKGKKSWSECLLNGLKQVETEYILYMQEDYFLNDQVRESEIKHLLKIMIDDDVDVIRLMDFHKQTNAYKPYKESTGLMIVPYTSPYRIHTQASIWKKSCLEKYLKIGETGWEFERYGSIRSSKNNDLFLCVDHTKYIRNMNDIVPYQPTGIIKGKWYKDAVIPLFRENGIDIDLSKRGIYEFSTISKIYFKIRFILRSFLVKLLFYIPKI